MFSFLRNIFCKPQRRQPRAAVDDFEIAYNLRRQQQQEVDRILDKIAAKGMGNLTKKERNFLEKR
ncbi:MAG: hypothetical protein LBF55_01205 [Prevotellaceae bacterium]|nr:hypothetical protein [Prevotellaceae bacterium]